MNFISENENENIEINFPKLNELKISHLSKLGLNFPYYKNIEPNNILEFLYDGNISSNDFTLINKFQNLTRLKLINNIETFKALINFKNLEYLSIINCPSAEIIIESEEIAKKLKYFEFDDEEIIKFKFMMIQLIIKLIFQI